MTPLSQQTLINTCAYHIGNLVLAMRRHSDRDFTSSVDNLIHELRSFQESHHPTPRIVEDEAPDYEDDDV